MTSRVSPLCFLDIMLGMNLVFSLARKSRRRRICSANEYVHDKAMRNDREQTCATCATGARIEAACDLTTVFCAAQTCTRGMARVCVIGRTSGEVDFGRRGNVQQDKQTCPPASTTLGRSGSPLAWRPGRRMISLAASIQSEELKCKSAIGQCKVCIHP